MERRKFLKLVAGLLGAAALGPEAVKRPTSTLSAIDGSAGKFSMEKINRVFAAMQDGRDEPSYAVIDNGQYKMLRRQIDKAVLENAVKQGWLFIA